MIPKEVEKIVKALEEAEFEAYIVGGSVRDLLIGKDPYDWDVTTSAVPEEIQKVFPKSFYANEFGTVTVKEGELEVEVTTYRVDGKYSDQRRPDEVKFTKSLKEDLARRDFTVNALAIGEGSEGVVIDDLKVLDYFGGLKDLNAKVIRCVGKPEERFSEDALRMLRAVRLAAQLDFEIEATTFEAIKKLAKSIEAVSQERIRDELVKLVMSERPAKGFKLLRKSGLLDLILPEVAEGIGVGQNKHHVYSVYEHNVKSLQFAAKYEYSLEVRLAALLHDIGKPKTKRPQGNDFSFHAHEIVGARMAEKALKRLRFSKEQVKKVSHLVRQHMFYYDVDKVTEAGARRLLRRVGKENFDDLIKLRIAERKGSGVPKAEPYRLRHLQFLVEKAQKAPISVNQLEINGGDLIKELKMRPGPLIGGILNALLAQVLEDPDRNKREYLLEEAEKLKDKDPKELKALGESAKEDEEKRREDDIRKKYHV